MNRHYLGVHCTRYIVSVSVLLFLTLVWRNPLQSQAQVDPRIFDLAWNQDGTMLALARVGGVIEIVDDSGQSFASSQVTTDDIRSIAWSPANRNVLAFGTLYGIIQVISVGGSEYETLLELPLPEDASPQVISVREVAWNAKGTHLAVNGETGGGASSVSSVRVWDVATGNLVASYQDTSTLTDIAWHPTNSDIILITGVENNVGAHITLWDPVANSVEWKIEEVNSLPISVAWSPDGMSFASSTMHVGGVIIRIHDASTGTELKALVTSITSDLANITWSPSINLAVSGYNQSVGSGIVEVWNENANNIIETVQTSSPLSLIDWAPSGELTLGESGGVVELNTDIMGTIPELDAITTPESGS